MPKGRLSIWNEIKSYQSYSIDYRCLPCLQLVLNYNVNRKISSTETNPKRNDIKEEVMICKTYIRKSYFIYHRCLVSWSRPSLELEENRGYSNQSKDEWYQKKFILHKMFELKGEQVHFQSIVGAWWLPIFFRQLWVSDNVLLKVILQIMYSSIVSHSTLDVFPDNNVYCFIFSRQPLLRCFRFFQAALITPHALF